MAAYSRWALIRGWALIRINTVLKYFLKKLANRTITIKITATNQLSKNKREKEKPEMKEGASLTSKRLPTENHKPFIFD